MAEVGQPEAPPQAEPEAPPQAEATWWEPKAGWWEAKAGWWKAKAAWGEAKEERASPAGGASSGGDWWSREGKTAAEQEPAWSRGRGWEDSSHGHGVADRSAAAPSNEEKQEWVARGWQEWMYSPDERAVTTWDRRGQ